ncbi:hypothetical protein F6X42_44140, partial [Paraburkholderia sp. WC7.3b]|nr:hypothetical protein [Paraburkholderia podalyriae]
MLIVGSQFVQSDTLTDSHARYLHRSPGWRLLVSAKGEHRTEGMRYAIDNGAWTAYQRGEPFDEAAFLA